MAQLDYCEPPATRPLGSEKARATNLSEAGACPGEFEIDAEEFLALAQKVKNFGMEMPCFLHIQIAREGEAAQRRNPEPLRKGDRVIIKVDEVPSSK